MGKIRSWIERTARGKTLWRRLPADFGKTPILVSPDARLQHLKRGEAAFDRELLRLASEHVRRESIVWDIGANVGVFSFAAASRATGGCVIAVEPDSWLFGLLQRGRMHSESAAVPNILAFPQ